MAEQDFEIKRTPEELGKLLESADYEVFQYENLSGGGVALMRTDWTSEDTYERFLVMKGVAEALRFVLGKEYPAIENPGGLIEPQANLPGLLEKGKGRFDEAFRQSVERLNRNREMR